MLKKERKKEGKVKDAHYQKEGFDL